MIELVPSLVGVHEVPKPQPKFFVAEVQPKFFVAEVPVTTNVPQSGASATTIAMKAELLRMKNFVDGIIKSGQKWTDPDFPPNADSLIKGIDASGSFA